MIIEAVKYINIVNRRVLGMQRTDTRCFSVSNVKKAFLNLFGHQHPMPPYHHMCQVGDPVLRTKAKSLDPELLVTPQFGKIFDQLHDVMKKFETVGISAPQIGLPFQIFAIEVTEESLKKIDPEIREYYEMVPIPLMYFANPTLEIINPEEVTFIESCGSLIGFQAEVPRAKEIKIKAYNRLGETFSWNAKGWTARIAQHEYDHLNGSMYIDKMIPSTFEFIYWEQVNKNKGEVKLKYKL